MAPAPIINDQDWTYESDPPTERELSSSSNIQFFLRPFSRPLYTIFSTHAHSLSVSPSLEREWYSQLVKLLSARAWNFDNRTVTIHQMQDFLQRHSLQMLWDKERPPTFDERGYFRGFLRGGRLTHLRGHYFDHPQHNPRDRAELAQRGSTVISNDELVEMVKTSYGSVRGPNVHGGLQTRPAYEIRNPGRAEQQPYEATWRGASGRIYTVPTGALVGSNSTYHPPVFGDDDFAHRPNPSGTHGLSLSQFDDAQYQYGQNR